MWRTLLNRLPYSCFPFLTELKAGHPLLPSHFIFYKIPPSFHNLTKKSLKCGTNGPAAHYKHSSPGPSGQGSSGPVTCLFMKTCLVKPWGGIGIQYLLHSVSSTGSGGCSTGTDRGQTWCTPSYGQVPKALGPLAAGCFFRLPDSQYGPQSGSGGQWCDLPARGGN